MTETSSRSFYIKLARSMCAFKYFFGAFFFLMILFAGGLGSGWGFDHASKGGGGWERVMLVLVLGGFGLARSLTHW